MNTLAHIVSSDSHDLYYNFDSDSDLDSDLDIDNNIDHARERKIKKEKFHEEYDSLIANHNHSYPRKPTFNDDYPMMSMTKDTKMKTPKATKHSIPTILESISKELHKKESLRKELPPDELPAVVHLLTAGNTARSILRKQLLQRRWNSLQKPKLANLIG